jgi:hypothetical protein
MSSASSLVDINLPTTVEEVELQEHTLQQRINAEQTSYKKDLDELIKKKQELNLLNQKNIDLLQKKLSLLKFIKDNLLQQEKVQAQNKGDASNKDFIPSPSRISTMKVQAQNKEDASNKAVIPTQVRISNMQVSYSRVESPSNRMTSSSSFTPIIVPQELPSADVPNAESTQLIGDSQLVYSELSENKYGSDAASDIKMTARVFSALENNTTLQANPIVPESSSHTADATSLPAKKEVDYTVQFNLFSFFVKPPNELRPLLEIINKDQAMRKNLILAIHKNDIGASRIMASLGNLMLNRLLLKITLPEIQDLLKIHKYDQYSDGSLANHSIILSPEHIDLDGTRYRLQVCLEGSMLIATATAWYREQGDSVKCITPWSLFLHLAIKGAFLNNTRLVILDTQHLSILSEYLQYRISVIQENFVMKDVGKQYPTTIILRLQSLNKYYYSGGYNLHYTAP